MPWRTNHGQIADRRRLVPTVASCCIACDGHRTVNRLGIAKLDRQTAGEPFDIRIRVLGQNLLRDAFHSLGASTVRLPIAAPSPSSALTRTPESATSPTNFRHSPRSSRLSVATSRRIARGTIVSVMSALPAALSFSQASSSFGFLARPGS